MSGVAEQERPLPPPKTEYDRRQILRLFLMGGIGAASGLLLEGIYQRENWEEFLSISDEHLLELARLQYFASPKPLQFGIYPDMEKPGVDPWQQCLQVKEQVGRLNKVGFFLRLEQLRDENFKQKIQQTMYMIQHIGAECVLSVGTGEAADWEGHPFSKSNEPQMLDYTRDLTAFFLETKVPTTVRLFFEVDMPNFVYGPTDQLKGKTHARRFRETFYTFQDWARRSGAAHVKFAFSPSVLYTIEDFLIERNPEYQDDPWTKLEPDEVGVDGYDLFPGSFRVFHPYYWTEKTTPEQVFGSAIETFNHLIDPQIPRVIYETASLSQDVKWLRRAGLFWIAMGGQGIMHFNYDKRNQRKIYEGNWTMTQYLMDMYRKFFDDIERV